MATKEQVLDIMRGWIGKSSANGTHTDIVDLYNNTKPLPRGYKVSYFDSWCAVTISAAFTKAGAPELIGRECGVERYIDIFKSKRIWIEDGNVTPAVGDIITFNWDDNTQENNGFADHIGIVESVSGGTIHTIEGNTSNMVARRTYKVGDGRIRGYARPRYDLHAVTPPTNSLTTVAKEVIAGKWGDGQDRINRLTKAGYNPDDVQREVNRLYWGNESVKPTNEEVAREVIAGKWGNGEERIRRLKTAGYDPVAIQALVNKLM